MRPSHSSRFAAYGAVGSLLVATLLASGCTSLLRRDSDQDAEKQRLEKLLKVPAPPGLVREAAVSQGLNEIRIEGVAVVNGLLPGTGGPALPSSYRDMLLEEMKRDNVPDPNQYLERDDNALVNIRALIPPGARRGDLIDLQVLTPDKTEVSNLHGGWLLDTRLKHQQVLNGNVRSSDTLAIGTGPVLTRADFDGADDAALQVSGRVLSGGLVQKDRKLSLILRPDFQHVKMATEIARVINERFYFFDGTTRRGIAKAVEDDLIQIDVLPRYRGNEARLLAVVGAIGVAKPEGGSQAQLVRLSQQLADVSSAADAALQLEAMGETAVPTLIDALSSNDPEIRFYAAEALAYLDRSEAIDSLIGAIGEDPAFRAPAFAALEGMPHPDVNDALMHLFDSASLETRYGAFVTLRERPEGKGLLAGEVLGSHFRLYQIASAGPPTVVISLTRKPEIVLLGDVQPPNLDKFLIGPAGLMARREGEQIRVSRFQPGTQDAQAEVGDSLAEMLRGIVRVGGNYGDAVATLRMAKEQGVLLDQIAFDPLPEMQRTYHREKQ